MESNLATGSGEQVGPAPPRASSRTATRAAQALAVAALVAGLAGALATREPALMAKVPPRGPARADAATNPTPAAAWQRAAGRTLEEATESFRSRRYAEAYGHYAALADRGDPQAAWMALFMVANGPTLYGSRWSVTLGQFKRWSALAQQHAEHRAVEIAAHDRGD